MKITYVTVAFPAPSETFAATDIATLRDAGAEVNVLALRPELPGAQAMLSQRGLEHLDVVHGGWTTALRGMGLALRRPRLLLKLLGLIARTTTRRPAHCWRSLVFVPATLAHFARIEGDRPEVVHLFWGHFPALVGYLVQQTLPGTVVSHFLGAYDLEMQYGPSAAVARDADVVWTHAHYNRPLIERLGVESKRLQVAHRGTVVPDLNRPVAAKLPLQIVTAGRLIRSKGMEEVLQVFHRVRNQWPEATLVIAGDGPERGSLEQTCRNLGLGDAVKFTGHLPQRELFRELELATVFLSMSFSASERLPNVVKEAVLRGCVCVVTRTAGIEELIGDAHGIVVPLHDVPAAAEGVQWVFSCPEEVRPRAEAAMAHVLEHFSVTRTMHRHLDLWRDLASRKQRRWPSPNLP